MEPRARTLTVYTMANGRKPFEEWLSTLADKKAVAAILGRLNRVRFGNFGDAKPVGDGVIELRIHMSPGFRVYVAEDGPVIVIILAGGDKFSQRRDIMLAQNHWRDYQE